MILTTFEVLVLEPPTVAGTTDTVLSTLPGVCLSVDRFCQRHSATTLQDSLKLLQVYT